MENNNPPTTCPFCQSSIKYIPAGISKKNHKPYNEFWACNNRDCNFSWKPDKPSPPKGNGGGELTQELFEKFKNLKAILEILDKDNKTIILNQEKIMDSLDIKKSVSGEQEVPEGWQKIQPPTEDKEDIPVIEEEETKEESDFDGY